MPRRSMETWRPGSSCGRGTDSSYSTWTCSVTPTLRTTPVTFWRSWHGAVCGIARYRRTRINGLPLSGRLPGRDASGVPAQRSFLRERHVRAQDLHDLSQTDARSGAARAAARRAGAGGVGGRGVFGEVPMNASSATLHSEDTRALLAAALHEVHGADAEIETWTAGPLSKRGKRRVVRYDLHARVAGAPHVQRYQWVGK